jgi:general secretion pathway protein C
MGFILSERSITALNFLLIAIIVYFLAQSVSNAVKLHYAGNITPAESTSAALPRFHPGIRTRAYYNTIVQRDIFSLTPAPEAAPVENENLNITLLGTSHLNGGKPFMIIEQPNGDEQLFRLGDTIPNAGRVLEIGQNRAIILHNGHRVAIEIPHENLPSTAPFRALPRRPGFPLRGPIRAHPLAGVRRLSSNRFVLARATLDNNMNNMAKLFTEIRATPNLENGSANGFRLSEIVPGSIFDQIGLRDGDILTGAEGQSVNDPMKALSLVQTLRDRSSITLNVVRNGAPMQIFYNIR